MLLLAVALREYVNTAAKLEPGLRELLSEVVLLKARTLLEFVAPLRKKEDQIRVEDFGQSSTLHGYGKWYGKLSTLTVHLSWDRTAEDLPRNSGTEGFALRVLKAAAAACSAIRERGVRLVASSHRRRHRLVREHLLQVGVVYPAVRDAAS